MNVSSVVNHFSTANKGFITTLGSTISAGATTIPLTSVSGLTNGTVFVGLIEPGLVNEQEFTGTVDTAGVQITGVKWTDGTNVDHTAGVTIVDYVAATDWNMNTKGILVEHGQTGAHSTALITSRTEDTAPDPDEDYVLTYDASATALKKAKLSNLSGATDGWISNVLPAVSSVSYSGNRSYDITFASTVASILSSGMRLKGTKTVVGNGYMGGAFNGSSHYFTKVTPSGTLGTVTNNFTIEAVVQPTSYVSGWIACRGDATSANLLGFQIQNTGQITATVVSGGTGNFRYITTYQSLPLNKKTHVAASWTGGTVAIYFDGVSVPVQAPGTAGTAPTTAGTGGDFSIGRKGANNVEYFPGYISNVAVFDAVLSAATIKQHATYKLLGSETNCIGAWSLDNVATDASASANNLTATGGVGYTAISPHGTMGDAVHTDQFCALVMSVSTTTATVQVPEGVTINTSGSISSPAYAVQGNPYGWVSDKGRWEVLTWLGGQGLGASQSVWYSGTTAGAGSYKLNIPVGGWDVFYQSSMYGDIAGAVAAMQKFIISTNATTPASSEYKWMVKFQAGTLSANSYFTSTAYKRNFIALTAATDYYLLAMYSGVTGNIGLGGNDSIPSIISALPSGL